MTEEEKDGSSQGSHESEKSNDDDSDKNEENEHEPQEDKKKKPLLCWIWKLPTSLSSPSRHDEPGTRSSQQPHS
jgi:hypothetical protein